jgi:hypothetical protein
MNGNRAIPCGTGASAAASIVRARRPLLAVLVALHAAGCGGTGSDESESAVYDDAGNCVKDREALSEILVQPQACVSSAECPPGSFCNGETGQCDWECYTDSDCGFAATCSCDGICQDGSPPGPGATGDPACPRDLDLLQDTDPDIHSRECTRDEHCPYGARCDGVTHRCDYDCLSDADCTGGTACDCRGECVEPGCDAPLPDQRPPTVEVTPDVITVLPGNTWGKQTFSIRITHPDAQFGAGVVPRARIEAPTPTGLGNLGLPQSEAVAESINTYVGVHFSTTEESRALDHANNASAATLISNGIPAAVANRIVAVPTFANLTAVLDVDGAGASTLQALKTATEITASTSCTLQVRELLTARWVVSTTNGYSATTSGSISRCSALDDYPRDLFVSVYFVDAADTSKVVRHLAYRTVRINTEGAPSVTATPATGEFSGYLIQEGAAGDPLTVPVRAFSTAASSLKIFDDLRLLSATGWFELSTAGATFLNHIAQTANDVSPGQTPGSLGGTVTGWTDELLTGGRRAGHFTLTLASAPGQSLTFRYQLVRKGDVGTAPPAPGNPTSSANTLVNISDAWRAIAGFVHGAISPPNTTRNNLVERLLCYSYDNSLGTALPLVGPGVQEAFAPWPQLLFSSASGDAECSKLTLDQSHASHAQTAFGVVTGWEHWAFPDWNPTPTAPITNPPDHSAAWLSECLNDLSRGIPNLGTATTVTEKTEAWFGAPGSCVNLAQILPAFASVVHEQVDGPATRYIDRRDATLFQRLLAQWLDVHAFVLLQGVQDQAAAAPLVTGDSAPPIATLLERADRAWDVLLDPDYLNALNTMSPRHVAIPDYRRPRPTSYWTFDTADRSTNHMVDVAGGNHLDFTASPSNDGAGITLNSTTTASIPANRLSPTGDVALTFWLKSSTVSPANTDVYIFNAGNAFFVRARKNSTDGRVVITTGHGGFSFPSLSFPTSTAYQHVTVLRRDGYYYVVTPLGTTFPETSVATTSPGANTNGVTIVGPSTGGTIAIDDLAIWENGFVPALNGQIVARGQSNTPPNNISRPLLQPIGSVWTTTSPYYRPEDPNAEQGIGLPIKILETASRHADAVDVFASQQLARAYDGCYATGMSPQQQASIARAAASLRYVNAAESVARKLRAQAGQVACTAALECTAAGASTCGGQGVCMTGASPLDVAPAWDDRYQAALLEFAAARGRAIASIRRLGACENPLGIPEDDLPIYFGDVEGTNSRYFASSDYLAASWARPAAQSALYSLEAAREGWLAKRDSDIRQLMNEYEAERRLDGIETSFMHPVVDACGLSGVNTLEVLDLFAGGMTATSCYRVADCTPANDPSCLRGSLGEAMLSVTAANKALSYEMKQSAKRELEWIQQIETCQFVEDSLDTQLAAVAYYKAKAYEAQESSNGWFGDAVGVITDGLDAVSNGVASRLGFDDLMEDTLEGCMSGGKAGCFIGFVGSDRGAREDLEIARAEMDAALAIGRAQIELYGCWDEIERRQRDWIFGKDAILLRTFDLKQAWYRFNEQVRAVDRQIDEARAAVAREEGRTLPSVAHHYWVDEKIARFDRDFARAKRFSYLAMRAVENEFQQSLGLRTAILTASHPDDLIEALDILDAERATRSINSRRPAPGTEVLSLRTDILGLGDLYAPETGERADAASLRLQDMLTSPEYAYYDENGEYLGQAIPFTVAESGALRHRCGERLWRVTATIQGDLTDVDEPRAQVYLLKRNVFKSQWCEGLDDGSPYQQGSTAGGSNLFTADATTVGRQGSEHTPALIYPWYNVRRSDFYRDDYTQGSSEELAGRGLYGEYVLLFPHYGMLEPPADCVEENVCDGGTSSGCSDPFRDLRRIEDVLIRFDYLSVDDL